MKALGGINLESDQEEERTEELEPDESPVQMTREQTKSELFSKKELEEAGRRSGRRGFRLGAIVGMLVSLFCAFLFLLVILQSNVILMGKKGTKEDGAQVLTDQKTLSLLRDVQDLILEEYLEDVDSEELVGYMFKGIAVGLDDPYANYYTKKELQSVLDSSSGEYTGIGATMQQSQVSGEIYVVQVYEESPAARAGLQTGDVLRKINDSSVAGMDLSGLVWMIKGMEDAFAMEVYRPETDEELTLTMQCEDIVVKKVEYELLEHQIGYIRLTEFTESAVSQFAEAAEDMKAHGMKKLIVDLRDNPGGLLNSVCDILDQILPEGLIVYMEDKDGHRVEYHADDERSIDCEVAVLVNGYSASASEIFAGAIQDYEIGPVIGTQTYGKGVVQKTYSLSDGSAFKLTVQKYFTPKGQDIDGNGITPDILVDVDADADAEEEQTDSVGDGKDVVLERALEVLTDEPEA